MSRIRGTQRIQEDTTLGRFGTVRPRVQIPGPRPDFEFRIGVSRSSIADGVSQPGHRFASNSFIAKRSGGAGASRSELGRPQVEPMSRRLSPPSPPSIETAASAVNTARGRTAMLAAGSAGVLSNGDSFCTQSGSRSTTPSRPITKQAARMPHATSTHRGANPKTITANPIISHIAGAYTIAAPSSRGTLLHGPPAIA